MVDEYVFCRYMTTGGGDRLTGRPIWLGPWRLHGLGELGTSRRFGWYWQRTYLDGDRRRSRFVRLFPLPSERPLRAKDR